MYIEKSGRVGVLAMSLLFSASPLAVQSAGRA